MILKRILSFLILSLIISCADNSQKRNKKGLNLFYVVLDNSSNSYSSKGGREENYIKLDSVYLNDFISNLYRNINKENQKNDLVLFFNYVDKDSRGNKELFLKLTANKDIDSIYKPKAGQVVSSREKFENEIEEQKKINKQLFEKLLKDKEQIFKDLNAMLNKSEKTSGSDCSGILKIADKKLNTYLVDTTKYVLKNKYIIAFSDLVNYPKNNSTIELKNKILRPGYSSSVPFLKEDDYLLNITTQAEFDEYLSTILNN